MQVWDAVVNNAGTSVLAPLLEIKKEDVDTMVNGIVTVTGALPPTGAATPPTVPAADVISMFSDVYPDIIVDSWRADWSQSGPAEDLQIDGDNTKMYTTLNYAGILFETSMIDASEMAHFHLDVYAPTGTNFKVKLVSFPPDSPVVQTLDLVLDSTTTPAFNSGGWSYLEIPLGDFNHPEDFDWANLGQLVISTSDSRLVLLDNVYFHK